MERIPLVDLRAQYASIKPEIDAAIQKVLDSAGFIMGPEVAIFEGAFARYLGAHETVGVASGTAALHLAFLALGIGPGDEVITTPYTFYATAEAIVQAGAQPVFVDVQPDTLNLNPDCVEAAITSRTRAIAPVHLFGQPADMDEILAIARRHGLFVIEDAAQAHGAEYRGRRCGTLGTIGCFSFFPSKNLGCYGDSGAVSTNDPALAARVRRLRDHGRIGKYEHVEMGWAYRIDTLQSAVLAAKLPHLEKWTAQRRAAAQRYHDMLAGTDLVLPVERPHNRHVYHCYVVRTARRDAMVEHLTRQGIGVGVHYPIPLHLQPVYKLSGDRRGEFPVAEAAAQQVLSLPLYPEITVEQQTRVVAAVEAFAA